MAAAASPAQAMWMRGADALAEILESVGAQQEPELEGAEPPPQGDRPLAVVGDLALAEGLEVVWTDAEGADLRFGVRQELDRAVELRTEPLVGIEGDTVGSLDAVPQLPQLGTDHRRTRPRGVDVDVEIVLSRHFDGLAQSVRGTDRCAPDAQDDPGREEPRRAIHLDRFAERLRIEGPRTIGRNLDEVLLADPGDADRLVDRRVGLR